MDRSTMTTELGLLCWNGVVQYPGCLYWYRCLRCNVTTLPYPVEQGATTLMMQHVRVCPGNFRTDGDKEAA